MNKRTNLTIYDTNLEKALKEENINAPVAYNLDEEYLDYVAFISRKIQIKILKGINEIGRDYQLDENNMVDILLSSFKNKEGNDE